MDRDGKYNKLLSGGGICHAMLMEKVTAKQAEKVIKYSINAGVQHFALNAVYSVCLKNHSLFGNLDICSICGEKIIEKATRTVGFFTPISTWEPIRRDWEFPNRKFVKIED
jgi:ribonucleoside-triphosphate reductase (formate)